MIAIWISLFALSFSSTFITLRLSKRISELEEYIENIKDKDRVNKDIEFIRKLEELNNE